MINPLDLEWCKNYFRGLLSKSHPNMRIGNEMKFGMKFRLKDGTWTDYKHYVTIKKEEL
jgi:hypothetical protein